MKRSKSAIYFGLFVLCIMVVGVVWFCVRGERVQQDVVAAPSAPAVEEPTSFSTAEPSLPDATLAALNDEILKLVDDKIKNAWFVLYEINGTILYACPDSDLEESFSMLEAAGSMEELERVFRDARPGSPARLPAAGVVVTLQAGSFTREAVTDAEGRFQFVEPRGEYELYVEEPTWSSRTGRQRMAIASQRIKLDKNRPVTLELRADLASVRGRVTDSRGQPIAGAKVTTIFDNVGVHSDEVRRWLAETKTRSAVSDADGFYELRGLVPTDFWETAGYLVMANAGQLQKVDIRVQADGFVQSKENRPRVPLVTEEGLYWGRRFLRVLQRFEEDLREEGCLREIELREKEDLSLPSIEGNTITGIDVVLE